MTTKRCPFWSRKLLVGWVWLTLLFPHLAYTREADAPAGLGEAYRVGVGDVLLIMVEGQPELSGSYTVARDGSFLMPLLRRVRAVELTAAELEKGITERLAKDYIVDPKVSVGIREYNSRQVYVMVGSSAVISRPIGAKGTLSEMLLESGIPAKLYCAGEATVTRTEPAEPGGASASRVVATVDLERLMAKSDLTQDVKLRRGDVVRIPSPESRFVYLIAGEAPAASVPLGAKGTLSELLLSVNIPSSVFSSGQATVTRTESGKPGEAPTARVAANVDLRKLMIEHDLKEDCALQHGDIVHVPSPANRIVYLMVGDAPALSAPLGEKSTLSELLLTAKLPSRVFTSGQVTVTRTEPAKPGEAPTARVVATVDLRKLMIEHELKEDCLLKHGDIVQIPSPADRFVYLSVGEGPALGMALGEKSTLSELLLSAKLPATVFSFGDATVTRTETEKPGDPPKARVVATVDLKALMVDHDLSKDCILTHGDIVAIPSSASRAVYLMLGDRPVQSHQLGADSKLSVLLRDAKVPASIFEIGRATVTRIDAKAKPQVVAEVDLAGLMLKHDAALDVELEPSDIIRIPEATSKFIYLLIERSGGASGRSGAGEVRRSSYGLQGGGRATGPAASGRPQIQKLKHPLGELTMLSQVLLDAGVEPELFQDCAAVVSRIDKPEVGKDGKVVQAEVTTSASVDLYELILKMDRSQDVELRPNDLVYIVPRRKMRDRGHVYALGAVRKPGAYECRPRYDARELVADAGGYFPEGVHPGLIITRGANGRSTGARHGTFSVENTQLHATEFLIECGDTVYVPPTKARRDGHVTVIGHVGRTGDLKYEKGMTVGDALKKAGGSNGIGSLGKIVVKRPTEDGTHTVARLLNDVLEKRHGGRGPELAPGDIVVVHP